MRGFSKAIITGNITRDPELRSTPNGASDCSFSVAVNRNYRDSNGETKEEVSFIDCSAWGKPGEIIAQYGKKGTGILVSGRLSQHSWEDKNTGQKRSRIEVVVEDFNFCQGERNNNEEGSSRSNFGAASMASEMNTSNSNTTEEEMPTDIPEGEIEIGDIPF